MDDELIPNGHHDSNYGMMRGQGSADPIQSTKDFQLGTGPGHKILDQKYHLKHVQKAVTSKKVDFLFSSANRKVQKSRLFKNSQIGGPKK